MAVEASIVIPTFNRADSLQNCLHALEKQTLGTDRFEVLVVDDGSTDHTPVFIERFIKQTDLLLKYFQQNRRGPAAARNFGISASRSDLIAFIDDDCVPESVWLENLIKAMPENKKCAGVGGKIVRLNNTLISRYIDDSRAMNHGNEKGKIRYLVTANALYRRSCLLEVEGFDTSFKWPGGEDPDLSFRMEQLGYVLASTDDAVIRHEHRDTLRGLSKMFFNHGRGKFALIQLGRIEKKNIWTVLIRQYIRSVLNYLDRSELKMSERIMFCVLRWIQFTSIHLGYMHCRNTMRQK